MTKISTLGNNNNKSASNNENTSLAVGTPAPVPSFLDDIIAPSLLQYLRQQQHQHQYFLHTTSSLRQSIANFIDKYKPELSQQVISYQQYISLSHSATNNTISPPIQYHSSTQSDNNNNNIPTNSPNGSGSNIFKPAHIRTLSLGKQDDSDNINNINNHNNNAAPSSPSGSYSSDYDYLSDSSEEDEGPSSYLPPSSYSYHASRSPVDRSTNSNRIGDEDILPYELLAHVFSYLSVIELIHKIRLVSNRWKQIADDDQVIIINFPLFKTPIYLLYSY